MSRWDTEAEGGWTLADHARRIIEREAWERRQAERAEAAFAQRRAGFALGAGEQYERMKSKRKVGGQRTRERLSNG